MWSAHENDGESYFSATVEEHYGQIYIEAHNPVVTIFYPWNSPENCL